MSLDDFRTRIECDGWWVLPNAVEPQMLERLRNDMARAYQVCRRVQLQNGIENAEHTVHHLSIPGMGRSFLDYLETMAAWPYIAQFFGGPFVLQSMGGNFNPPGGTNYAGTVHRDIRSYSCDRLMLNTIIALDDLTAENGATWVLPGSHHGIDDWFDDCAEQITAPAGSVILFDSRVWHKAGVNRSDKERRIITPIFTRPFYKPGFDYCRAWGYDAVARMSEELRQVLGYHARVPATLEEWYQKPERRAYRGDQG